MPAKVVLAEPLTVNVEVPETEFKILLPDAPARDASVTE